MYILHSFQISPKEYQQRGKKNHFPEIEIYPLSSRLLTVVVQKLVK